MFKILFFFLSRTDSSYQLANIVKANERVVKIPLHFSNKNKFQYNSTPSPICYNMNPAFTQNKINRRARTMLGVKIESPKNGALTKLSKLYLVTNILS